MLLKHGLLGGHRFTGKTGALDYIKQTGCIQFDPVDVCGKNAELVLQSRIKGFTKTALHDLLYKDRSLIDCFDKQLAIIPAEDWPYFERYRQIARRNLENYPEMKDFKEKAKAYIDKNGPCNSDGLPPELEGEFRWHSAVHWSSGKNKARAVLEQMYSEGELIVHHKKGTRKYYDIAGKHIPLHILSAGEPLPDDTDHFKWRILRRIGATGLLWNRPSDAWLGIWGLENEKRGECFRLLLDEGKIKEVTVEGIRDPLFFRAEDGSLLQTAISDEKFKPRCEFIAPLDCIMWDRKLIKTLFDYHYAWEIYSPPEKRKYGYYVLPVLYSENFAGRIETAAERKTKTLVVKNIWYEEGFKQTEKYKKAELDSIRRFAKFNECDDIFMQNSK